MRRFIQLALPIVLFILGITTSFAQIAGDYRSAGSGNWDALSTWERYDGSLSKWVTPTTEGWPGQFTGTGAVNLQVGHTVTISNTGITTLPMGSLTIDGMLYLNGDNTANGINFNFDTQIVIITPNLATKAKIWFKDKANLILPPNATIFVGNDIKTKGWMETAVISKPSISDLYNFMLARVEVASAVRLMIY